MLSIVPIADRAAVGCRHLGGSACRVVGIARLVSATVGHLGGLRGFGIVLILRFITARIDFGGFIVSGISDRIIRIAVGKLLLGVERTKLAVFEVGAGQCVAIEKLRTQHVSKQIQSECGGVN